MQAIAHRSRRSTLPHPPAAAVRAAAALLVLALAAPAAVSAAPPDAPPAPHATATAVNVVRTFELHEADPAKVATILRTMLAVRLLAIDVDQRTLSLRDDAAKMALAERLVEIADRRPGEVEVAVELLEVDGEALARWLAGGGPRTAGNDASASGATHRLAPGELAAFERSTAATALARPRLSMVGNGPAEYELNGLPGGDAALRREFEIEVAARIHPTSGTSPQLTLDFEVALRRFDLSGTAGPTDHASSELVVGELSSSARLATGETYLVTGLGFAGGGDAVSAAAGGAGRAVVVALTPRVVWAPVPIPASLETLPVSTEADLGPTVRVEVAAQ